MSEDKPNKVRLTAYIAPADRDRLLVWAEQNDRTPSAAAAIALQLGLDFMNASMSRS